MAKYDTEGCLIREKYLPEDAWGNLGDSCAETARAYVLGHREPSVNFMRFKGPTTGFVRHPKLSEVHGWDEQDFTGDQFVALWLAFYLEHGAPPPYPIVDVRLWKVPATDKWLTPAAWALVRGHYRLLNLCNIVQGWLFNFSHRWNDEGHLEPSAGKVQDWLNYICIYVLLRNSSKWATLNQDVIRCIDAVETYYLRGDDKEPNSQWIVDLYKKALGVNV